MNSFLPPLIAAATLLFAAVAPVRAADPAAPAPATSTLQVEIIVPPSWRPMLEDRVADEFVSTTDEIFHREGYSGRIQQVTALDEPTVGCCLLTIRLLEWRIDPVGNINCTFNANLQTERTTRSLGLYTQTAFRWMTGPGRFGLAEALDTAAEGAIRELYDSLAKTKLIPGLRRR